ncbi:sodium:solute symporter family protein [Roseibacterium sp. SDUM158017]|uniref:sodium:solute symporter family protein n=1 Tax=Roseicyclus salinarum TaxID=3036773 RepID=UPI0024155BBE|nr:sodium:solute symporter family protein [Roseibacterium sp. SDUM158017]MDG4648436.1 sodium:solute symporter family protein [Roseibacterium sp. SDUM158017]
MIAPALVWTVIALFAALGVAIAIRAARANTGTAGDYYVGGRNIGGMVAGLSYAATTYSAFMLVVLTGLTYRGGIGALGFELIYFAGLSLLVVFAPRFWLVGRRWGFISPAEMIGARYGSRTVARAMAIVGIVFLLPYCTTQMAGIGLLLSGVTGGGISLFQAVATGAALAMFWALVAGLRSVAWTDAALSVVMFVSGLLAVGFAVSALGGPGAFLGTLQAEKPEWLGVPGPGLWSLPTFVALSFPWFFFALSNPQVSQRLFILKDFRAMRRMLLWVLGFGFLFTLIAVVWGLAALQLAPGLENTSMATPALLSSGVVPVWVAFLLILGILSAAISTLDSIALTVGAMVARDLVRRETASSDARQILAGRLMIVAVVLFASYFALRQTSIVDQLAALSAAGLIVSVPAIVGAFFWRRGTAAGALASILGGAGVAAVLAIFLGVSVFDPTLPFSVAGTSVALFVIVSLVTSPRPGALDFEAEIAADLARHRAW